PDLVQAVEVGAHQAGGLALVEVAAHPDVAVGQREDRLGLGEHVEVQRRLAERPRIDREVGVVDHRSSLRSATTTLAPCCLRASAWPTRSTPTTYPKLPARPASTPASASSKTTACAGSAPSRRAPSR